MGLRQAGAPKSKQKGIRAGKMVQFVERLPGKHEDSISITSTAKLGVAMAAAPELVVSPVSWRSRDRPGACWLASSTWVIFRAMGNPVSKDRVDGAS